MTHPSREPLNATAASAVDANADARQDPAMKSLYRMSRTAGVGLQDYAAVNVLAVIGLLLAVASVLVIIFGNVLTLLIVPLAAIVISLIALVQIRNSSGTQTGQTLAIIGVLLAAALGGTNVYNRVSEASQQRRWQAQLRDVVAQFEAAGKSNKPAEAYALFDSRFREVVKPETFDRTVTYRMQQTFNGEPVVRLELGPRVVFETGGASPLATALLTLYGEGRFPDGSQYRTEEPIEFRLVEGSWKIRDITNWFAGAAGTKDPAS